MREEEVRQGPWTDQDAEELARLRKEQAEKDRKAHEAQEQKKKDRT